MKIDLIKFLTDNPDVKPQHKILLLSTHQEKYLGEIAFCLDEARKSNPSNTPWETRICEMKYKELSMMEPYQLGGGIFISSVKEERTSLRLSVDESRLSISE